MNAASAESGDKGIGWGAGIAVTSENQAQPIFILDSAVIRSAKGEGWNIDCLKERGKIAVGSTAITEFATDINGSADEFFRRRAAARRALDWYDIILPEPDVYFSWLWRNTQLTDLEANARYHLQQLRTFTGLEDMAAYEQNPELKKWQKARDRGYSAWKSEVESAARLLLQLYVELTNGQLEVSDENQKIWRKVLERQIRTNQRVRDYQLDAVALATNRLQSYVEIGQLQPSEKPRFLALRDTLAVFLECYLEYRVKIAVTNLKIEENDRGDLDGMKYAGHDNPLFLCSGIIFVTVERKWLTLAQETGGNLAYHVKSPVEICQSFPPVTR